jgi:tRNA threonylcarbamoyladenosine biosynthesis protein TsaB
MSYILNIETSTKNCSVALSKNGKLIDAIDYKEEGYSHAEKLHVFIEQLVSKNTLSLKDLSAIAVSKGPGSYTGLRIGVSTAKGLSYALNIPLIAISTLEHMAHQIHDKNAFIIPIIDARRMEVYSAVFDSTQTKIREIKAEIIDENSFSEYLSKKKTFFIGDAVKKVKEVIKHPNAVFIENSYPSAKEMTSLSYKKLVDKDFVDTAYFEPFYLKDFIVTRKKNKPL